MQKKSGSSGELITWYLARLRNNARQTSLDRKLTPLSLVETDKSLIQEIVSLSHPSHEQRTADILKTVQQQNRMIRSCQTILLLLTVIGTLILLGLLFL